MENNLDAIRQVTDSVEQKYGLQSGVLFKMVGKESAYGTQMKSKAGAEGWFQFMPDTAKGVGLKDPYDLNQSADAAGKYLSSRLSARGGNYKLALADYNYGLGNVNKLLHTHQDNWEQHLPSETKDYLHYFSGEGKYANPKETPTISRSGWSHTEDLPHPISQGISIQDTAGKEGVNNLEHGGFLNSIADIPSDLALAGRQYSTLYNVWADKNLEYGNEDLSFLNDKKTVDSLVEGVPNDQKDYILRSRNLNDAMRRRSRWEESTRQAQELGLRGADGFIASLLVGGTDIPNVGAMLATAGVGQVFRSSLQASSMLSRGKLILGEAALGAGSNAATEAATSRWRPTATDEDIVNAAYLGAALGGLGGMFGKVENPSLAVENGALRKKALSLWKKEPGTDFTMETGTDLVKVIDGEVIPPAPKIGYEPLQIERAPIDGEFTNITETAGIPGRVALPGPEENISIHEPTPDIPTRPDNGTSVVIDREPPPKTPEPDVEVAPTGVKDSPPVPEPTSKFGKEWDTPKFDKGGYLELPESNSIHALADYIRKFSKNEDLKVIMNRILKGMKQGAKIRLKVLESGRIRVPKSHMKFVRNISGWRGIAVSTVSTGDSTIYLRGRTWGEGHGLNEETLIHELIHANAVTKYHHALRGVGGEEMLQAAQDLKDLFRHVARNSHNVSQKILASLKDADELLAYGLTNREVQAHLKSIPYGEPNKSLWDRFVKSVRNLLGIKDSEANAFTKLIDISSTLLKRDKATKASLQEADGIMAKYQVSDSMEPDPDVKKNGFPSIFGWGLSREYRLLNKGVPDRIKELAAKIAGNKVGYKDNSVIEHSVSEHADTLHRRWAVNLSKELWYKSGFSDWFEEMKNAGKYTAIQKDYQAKIDFQEQVQDYIRGFDNPEGWHPAVKAAGEGVRNLLGGDVLDNINNPSKIFNGTKRGLTQQEIRNPETGEMELTAPLEKNPNYIPRKLHYQKISNMVKRIGAEGIQDFFAMARKSNHPDITDLEAAKFGKWYYETFNESHAVGNENLLSDLVSGVDKNALKMSLMKNGGMSEGEALNVIEDMFPSKPKKSAVANSNLKGRTDINETYTATMMTKDGEQIEVSLNDFTDTNLEKNLHSYFKRMAGDIAFAHKIDIYNNSGWENLLNKTVRRDLGDPELIPEEKLNKWRKDLNWYRDMVKGIPQEASTWWTRSLDMAMKYNVVRLMGMAGLNQAIEWGNLVGSLGHSSLIRAGKDLDGLYRDARTGAAPNDIVDQIENLTGGAGSDFVKHAGIGNEDHWVRNGGDTKWNQRLDKASTLLSRSAHKVYKYNGMLGQMVQQQRMFTIGAVNHWFKIATGEAKSSFWLTPKRLSWMGIDDNMFTRITENIRKYATAKEGVSGQEAKTVDFSKWQKEDAESMWHFLWGMERESRRVVQENDMASALPLFDGSIGKAFFQFQGFGFHAWDKALMHGLSQKDYVIFSSIMHGGFVASLQYIGRTYMATLGMSQDTKRKYLERRLTAQQIVANSYGRVGFASILPQLVDTISPTPVFAGMRSTTDISSVFSSPVFQLINSGIATKKYIRNALSEDYQTTGRDVKATFNLLMLNNIPPMSILGNALAGKFPNTEQTNPE